MRNISNIVWASLCAVLMVLLILTYRMYKHSQDDVSDLQEQVSSLTEQVKKAAVVRHISKQMEDIAYQQKDISDKRSDEAIQQSKIANDMRSKADVMRKKAEEETSKAEESERKAVEAFNAARQQRLFAEEKQRQAEYAKRVADTLSYKALARSLGSLSSTQYQIGNKDLASLLAYSSWSFATRYKGDVYLPAVFNALSSSSQSVYSKNDNKGAITKIEFTGSPSSFITITKYGELMQWNDVQGQMTSDVLLRDPKCDFRDVKVDDNGMIYALSRNGELVVKSDKGIFITQLEGSNYMKICDIDQSTMLFVSDNALSYYDKKTLKLIKNIPLADKVSAVGNQFGDYILFCRNGNAYMIEENGRLKPMPLIIGSMVTAYAWSPSLRLSAVGTSSGKIFIYDEDWHNVKTLIGHRSAITQVGFNNSSLFSSSYDCTVNMWNLRMEKVEPITLKAFSSWVHCFNATESGVIWTGTESGDLSRILISPMDMAHKIKENLTRDMTPEEWNYYVGSSIPFESYKQQ